MEKKPIFYVRELANWTGGKILQNGPDIPVFGVSFDSRTIERGDLFVALIGQRDGHNFISTAVERGASALLVQREDGLPSAVPSVVVDDTLKALGDAARGYRLSRGSDTQIIAVTGSNGKTTTKELLRSIFQQAGPTLATEGNYNNLLGVPITLFRLRDRDKFAVIEMGMNAPGEIERLTQIVRPHFGIITSIAPAHLEGLGDIDGVADAKAELFQNLPGDGIAVVNADFPSILSRAEKLSIEKFYFSVNNSSNWPKWRAGLILKEAQSLGIDGYKIKLESRNTREFPSEFDIYLPLVGRHHLSNALAAAAVAWRAGLSPEQIRDGLAKFSPPSKRMELVRLSNRDFLLDDCYNSNPSSAEAALKTLVELAGNRYQKVAVLGDMLELGESAPQLHRELGKRAALLKIDYLITVGPLSKFTDLGADSAGMPEERRRHFEQFQKEEIKELLLQLSINGDSWFLVKASRGLRLERVSQLLREIYQKSSKLR